MANFGRAAISVLAIIGASAPLAAQAPRDLDAQSSDIRIFTGEVAEGPERFALTLPAGTALMIEAVATADSALDAYLRVTDAATGEVLAEDDDGAGALGARAFVLAEAERRIEIEVSAEGAVDSEREQGAFELSLRPTDWRPTPPRPIAFGERMTGRLVAGEDNLFQLDAAAGQMLVVTMRAGDGASLDPVLELRQGDGKGGDLLAEDDDGAGNLNARLTHMIRRAGAYTIVARGYGGSAGDYVLELGDGSAPVVPPPVELTLGTPESGQLGSGVGPGGDDVRQVAYRLGDSAKAALRADPGAVTIRLRSLTEDGGLDPVLDVGFDTPLGLAVVASDDDGGENLDAELTLDLAPLAGQPAWLDSLRFVGRSYGEADGIFTIEIVADADR